jgi:hypothetical protein
MAGISGEALLVGYRLFLHIQSAFANSWFKAIEWLLLSIAFFLILARLNLRLRLLRRRLILSDYFVLAAFIAGVALSSFDSMFYSLYTDRPGTTYHSLSQYVASAGDTTTEVLKVRFRLLCFEMK